MLAPATLDPTLIHDAVAESLSLAEWEDVPPAPTIGDGGRTFWLRWYSRYEVNRLDPSWHVVEARALDVLAVRRAPIPWLWRRP